MSECKCGRSLVQDSSGIRCVAGCAYDTERRSFIRAHASRLEAALLMGLLVAGREPVVSGAAQSWVLAKELWDAKPEDC